MGFKIIIIITFKSHNGAKRRAICKHHSLEF